MLISNIFKIGLLILGLILLYIFSSYDRYELHISTGEDHFVVFDKREGYVYVIGEDIKGYSLDIIGSVKKQEEGN
jgi:hypothetical protein